MLLKFMLFYFHLSLWFYVFLVPKAKFIVLCLFQDFPWYFWRSEVFSRLTWFSLQRLLDGSLAWTASLCSAMAFPHSGCAQQARALGEAEASGPCTQNSWTRENLLWAALHFKAWCESSEMWFAHLTVAKMAWKACLYTGSPDWHFSTLFIWL